MSTVVLSAYSVAYPAITNRIQASVYLQSSPLALVASIVDTTSGHPARMWEFAGLTRDNYIFSLDEIDSSGNPVNNLALFNVVPSQIDGILVRDDEQIQVDVTTGLVSGTTTFTLDGTGGKKDYRGWNITVLEYGGRAPMLQGVDYSWVISTGVFTLLNTGDKLVTLQYYLVHFDDQLTQAGGSTPIIPDFVSTIITTTYNILNSDFGSNLIVEPSGNYLQLNLPDITTVSSGRALTIEVGGTGLRSVLIMPYNADIIKYFIGNYLHLNTNESLEIYKFTRSTGVFEWRIRRVVGNLFTFGQTVGEDMIQSGVINKQLLDGTVGRVDKCSRLYNDYVLRLPSNQVCNFDDWTTGLNKYFFSLSNSADPANAGLFMFPDRRGVFERNNNTGKAGDYNVDQLKTHDHTTHAKGSISGAGLQWFLTKLGGRYSGGGSDGFGGSNTVDNEMRTGDSDSVGYTETFPKNILINKYILL